MSSADQWWNHNPFDVIEVACDIVRRDECERSFDVLRSIEKGIDAEDDWSDPSITSPDDAAYTRGIKRGLSIAMDELDERITYLRNRWG